MLILWLTKPTEYTTNLLLGKPEGIQSFPVGSELHPEGCCHRRQQARDEGGGRVQWYWCPLAGWHSPSWVRHGRNLWQKGLWRHWGALPTSPLPVALTWRSWDLEEGGEKIQLRKKIFFLFLQLKHASFLFKEYYYDLKEEKGRFQLPPLIFYFSCMNSDTSMLVWHA